MSITAALEELLNSPRLPEYAEVIRQRLADEQARRERLCVERTDEFKMEFIGGEVVMHSPALNRHLLASRHVMALISTWVTSRGPGLVHVEKALCSFSCNDYEPDLVYFGPEKAATITPDTLRFPVPDFIVEITSYTTEDRDRGIKFEDYAAHGVREYWIVDPDDESLEQYLLSDGGEYELRLKSGSGDVTSPILAGLTIPVRAIFDTEVNLRVLAKLLA